MLDKFERYPLTFGPTPIEKLDRLSMYFNNKVSIFAKREDCNSGLACGGNKIRKLEYIVPYKNKGIAKNVYGDPIIPTKSILASVIAG